MLQQPKQKLYNKMKDNKNHNQKIKIIRNNNKDIQLFNKHLIRKTNPVYKRNYTKIN